MNFYKSILCGHNFILFNNSNPIFLRIAALNYKQKIELMKKLVVVVLAVVLLGTIMISCRATQKCPAYGESGHYKVERPSY